jgi:DNA-methyltransferase (dcm)
MLKVLDLFSGAGGFSKGFESAGYEIVCAIENFKPVFTTYQYNFPSTHVIPKDIKEVHSKEVIDEVGNIDVIIGGPPCEAFTMASIKIKRNPLDRLYVDPRGMLVLHFIRFVADLKPIFFVMENVAGILHPIIKNAIIKEFKRIGYDKIFLNILRAEDYGNPSIRRRVFISNIKINPPKEKIRKTVRDALRDLPPPDSVHDIPNHEPVMLSNKKMKALFKAKTGQSLIGFYGFDNKVRGNYIRLNFDKPAPVVMGKSRFIHPEENRLLTVREHARLMSFPDNFIFFGGREIQFDQVGEAVPPILAKVIAEYCLNKSKELNLI